MNVKFEHRAHDLAATAIYTWANSKDDKSAAAGVGATGAGFRDSWTITTRSWTTDRPTSMSTRGSSPATSTTCPLVAARNTPMAVNRATDLLIGGWETTGIATFQTGFPYSITANDVGGVLNSQFHAREQDRGLRHSLKPHRGHATNQLRLLRTASTGCIWQHTSQLAAAARHQQLGHGHREELPHRRACQFQNGRDFFNAWNHHQYAISTGALIGSGSGGGSSIDNGVGSTTAGQITNASAARVIQISGKLTF